MSVSESQFTIQKYHNSCNGTTDGEPLTFEYDAAGVAELLIVPTGNTTLINLRGMF